jgi:hypothetical protein
MVAEDDRVSRATHRYAVPVRFIGQRVAGQRRADTVHIFHRGQAIATHPVFSGTHQFRILPEHGPGALARHPRPRHSTRSESTVRPASLPEVAMRDLAC